MVGPDGKPTTIQVRAEVDESPYDGQTLPLGYVVYSFRVRQNATEVADRTLAFDYVLL